MSIELTSVIWKYSPLRGTPLLCELALADSCNDQGVCWPLTDTLARKMRVTTRNAQLTLAMLEQRGDIYRQQARGRKHSNRFALLIALQPQEARQTLIKWFGMSPAKASALCRKVKWASPFLEGRSPEESGDPFERAAREYREKVKSSAQKARQISPRTIKNHQQPSRTVKEPSAAASASRPRTRRQPTAAAAARIKETATSLFQIFGVEEPNASRIAAMPHITDQFLEPWRLFKHASDTERDERGVKFLGPAFYAKQFADAVVAPEPPITQADLDAIPPRPGAREELRAFGSAAGTTITPRLWRGRKDVPA